MKIKNAITERFGLQAPLIVAPMGGGPTTPELVAASSNAGALGALAGAYFNPQQLTDAIKKTRSLTQKPFLINLFAPIPMPALSDTLIATVIAATQDYRTQLDLPVPELKPPFHPNFDQQFDVILQEKPAAFSFIFGLLDKTYIAECHKRNIYTIGTATSLKEGIALAESGVDAVIAQGIDAGGHHGMFYPEDADPLISTSTLTRLLVKNLPIPVIASGGIMDGASIAAALVLGAAAVQLGTAFLACDESGTSKAYRQALLDTKRIETKLTKVFSGRLARGIENRFMVEMREKENTVLPFPAQNVFTRDLRTKANAIDDASFLSLWAGSGVALLRQASAAELITMLTKEMNEALKNVMVV